MSVVRIGGFGDAAPKKAWEETWQAETSSAVERTSAELWAIRRARTLKYLDAGLEEARAAVEEADKHKQAALDEELESTIAALMLNAYRAAFEKHMYEKGILTFKRAIPKGKEAAVYNLPELVFGPGDKSKIAFFSDQDVPPEQLDVHPGVCALAAEEGAEWKYSGAWVNRRAKTQSNGKTDLMQTTLIPKIQINFISSGRKVHTTSSGWSKPMK